MLQHYKGNYRGVHAAERIAAHDTMLYVPKKLMLTTEIVSQTHIGRQVKEKIEGESFIMYVLFAQYILLERLKDPNEREWGACLALFPENFTELPLSYTEEELSYLAGSPYQEGIRKEQEVIKGKFAELCTAVPDFR